MELKGKIMIQAWDGKTNKATIEVSGTSGKISYSGRIVVVSDKALPQVKEDCVLTIPEKKKG